MERITLKSSTQEPKIPVREEPLPEYYCACCWEELTKEQDEEQGYCVKIVEDNPN